jgi:hypothetical protein
MRGAELIEVHDLTDKFLLCRTLGHSWDENPNPAHPGTGDKSWVGALYLRCTRCRCERYDYINNQMEVHKRYYRYPKGYGRLASGTTRPNLRAEIFSRSLLISRRNGGSRARKTR